MGDGANRLVHAVAQEPGLIGIAGAALASAGLNGLFGWQIAGGNVAFGVLSVALFISLDIAKWRAAFWIGGAWRQHWVRWLLALAILLGLIAVSIMSAIGAIGLNRGDVAAARTASQVDRAALERTITTALEEKSVALAEKKVATAEYEEQRKPANGGCGTRCRAAQARIDAAQQRADGADATIAEARAALAAAPAGIGAGDPTAAVLAWVLDWEQHDLVTLIAIGIAIVAELVSSVGFYVAGGTVTGRPLHGIVEQVRRGEAFDQSIAHVLSFQAERLEKSWGTSIGEDELYAAYAEWSQKRQDYAVSKHQFRQIMPQLVKWRSDHEGNRRYMGVRLKALVEAANDDQEARSAAGATGNKQEARRAERPTGTKAEAAA